MPTTTAPRPTQAPANGARSARAGRDRLTGRQLSGTFGDEEVYPDEGGPTVQDPEGTPTKGDVERMRREAQANPANANPDRVDNRTGPTADRRRASGRRQRQATGGARRLLTGKGPGHAPGNVAGFVMGFFLVAIALNMLENGPAAGWDWIKAKFVNETTVTGTGANTASPSNTSTNLLSGFSSTTDAVAGIAPGGASSPNPVIAPLLPGQTAPPLTNPSAA